VSTKDYPEDFPDKLDYALHTLSPTQRIAFESWAPKHEREDAKADAAVHQIMQTTLKLSQTQRIPFMHELNGVGSGLRVNSHHLA